MTAPARNIPRDLLEGILTGDDQRLANGFHEIYPSLVREAAAEVDDAAAAGRIVERAMLRVLAERDRVTDADTLDRALRIALHECAVREKSRRAALHRFERNEGVDNRQPADAAATAGATAGATEVWERIQHARRANTISAESHAVANREGKHLAAVHVGRAMQARSKWAVPALVLGLLVLSAAFFGITRIETGPTEKTILGSLAAADARPLRAGEGQIGNLSLADETVVALGSGSMMRTASGLGSTMRAVSLNGSASFTVPAGKQPLEIRSTGVAFSVDSGRVDISADSLEPILLRVREGQVRVTTGDSTWTATPGTAFIVDTAGAHRPATADELAEALSWLDGQFTVNGTVRDVVAGMRRWYGADIGIGDASLFDRPARVTGSLTSLTEVVKSLEKSADLRVRWSNGRMILHQR